LESTALVVVKDLKARVVLAEAEAPKAHMVPVEVKGLRVHMDRVEIKDPKTDMVTAVKILVVAKGLKVARALVEARAAKDPVVLVDLVAKKVLKV
jgi:hypothetical protein